MVGRVGMAGVGEVGAYNQNKLYEILKGLIECYFLKLER